MEFFKGLGTAVGVPHTRANVNEHYFYVESCVFSHLVSSKGENKRHLRSLRYTTSNIA